MGLSLFFLALGANPSPVLAQSPRDQVHLSLSLGGFVKVGIGFTHWMEEHHALEFTAFPVGLPMGRNPHGSQGWVQLDSVR